MEITFTRGENRTYTTQVLRDDGVLFQVPSYDRISPLPHDLAHYVVEHEMGLRHGLWGSIAAGAIFPGMRALSGRQPVHAAARSQSVLREAGQQGTEAEVFVSALLKIMHAGLDKNRTVACALLRETWRPDKPSRDLPDAEEMQRICAALRDAEQRWQCLDEGQSLTVVWPSERRSRR